MVRTKCLVAVLVGTFVYAFLSVVFGKDGVLVYSQLEKQKRDISARAAAIQKINDELALEYTALESDKNVIAAYARRLEYVSGGEKLVKITGLKPYENTLYDTGTVLRQMPVTYISEYVCKSIGFAFFALVMLILILSDMSRSGSMPMTVASKKGGAVGKGTDTHGVPQVG